MRTFKNMAAQGDFIIRRIASLPDGVTAVAPVDGKHTIAHSETGHNHTMTMDRVSVFKAADDKATDDDKLFHLFLTVDAPAEITHERSFDTHETILVPPGNYEIRRQREHHPEAWRRAAD